MRTTSNLSAAAAVLPPSTEPRPLVRYLGDPILREKCVPVSATHQVPSGLLTAMVELCKDWRKVAGISAPQLGHALQVFAANVEGRTTIFFNPTEIKLCGRVVKNMEGCLSIPSRGVPFRTQVPRYTEVKFRYETGQRESKVVKFFGHDAFVVQHELDHLDGKLIIDYASRQQRRAAERAVEAFQEKTRG